MVDSTVARMSGVTARTLRYYDEIDLLHPARVGENGYRYYESVQMLRLQPAACLRDAMIAHARARMR